MATESDWRLFRTRAVSSPSTRPSRESPPQRLAPSLRRRREHHHLGLSFFTPSLGILLVSMDASQLGGATVSIDEIMVEFEESSGQGNSDRTTVRLSTTDPTTATLRWPGQRGDCGNFPERGQVNCKIFSSLPVQPSFSSELARPHQGLLEFCPLGAVSLSEVPRNRRNYHWVPARRNPMPNNFAVVAKRETARTQKRNGVRVRSWRCGAAAVVGAGTRGQ